MIGWMLDAYDLTLMLFVAALLADLFFPKISPVAALMAVFASYALTLLSRPLGGVIFGHLADKWGRRPIMFITLIGAGIATALTGVLPTYQSIGLAATALFVLIRLIVGIFIGGEPGGSHTIAIESSTKRLRGLVGGVLQSGYMWGYAFGALTFIWLTTAFTHSEFVSYAWRYGFFMGLIVAALGVAVRLGVPESRMFKEIKEEGKTSRVPIAEFFREHARDWAAVLVLMSGLYWAAYASMGFVPAFLGILKVPSTESFWVVFYGAIIEGIFMWIGGHLSTYIKRKWMFVLSGALGVVLSYFLVEAIVGKTLTGMILGVGGLMAITGLGGGVMLSNIAEQFSTRIRGSAVGALWNLANIGSAIALIIAAPMVAIYGPLAGFASLMIVGYVITIVGALLNRDRTGVDLT